MIKMIFCDVDGTLVQYNEQEEYTISDDNRQMIRTAIHNGIRFALATGRPANFVPERYGKEFTLDTVAYSGAMVQDAEGQMLYESSFTLQQALTIYRLVEKEDAELLCISRDNDYVFAGRRQQYMAEFLDPATVRDHRDLIDATLKQVAQQSSELSFVSLVVLCHDPQRLERLAQRCAQLSGLDPVMTRPDGYSLMKKGVNKAYGIRLLAEKRKIALNEIAVLGDSKNDLEMFDLIEQSYAMENSHPLLKEKAGAVVKTVADALRRIMEINRQQEVR